MGSQQLLVAGDDRLAQFERSKDQGASGFDATDQLDDHVDVGIVHQRTRIIGQAAGIGDGVPVLVDRADRDGTDREADTGALSDRVAPFGDQVDEGTTDGAAAKQSNGQFVHGRSVAGLLITLPALPGTQEGDSVAPAQSRKVAIACRRTAFPSA